MQSGLEGSQAVSAHHMQQGGLAGIVESQEEDFRIFICQTYKLDASTAGLKQIPK